MSVEDYFDVWGDPDYLEEPNYIICKYCGTGNLLWEEFETGWRLVDRKNEIHICESYFEVVDENI